jgi:allophanate hydrolase
VTETVAAIVAAHRAGTLDPVETVARSFQRIRDYNDPAVFISLRDENNALGEAESLKAKNAAELPLYGVPVAVKDNIDALGFQTTAACPAFAYTPAHDSTAVARLRAAGAIIIGKTNLDQFATGLVGVRSPYGIPNNPMRADLIPGGSSSGSAVAVSAGLVPLALGTDTAGSGRVPAMLNNIVGLKPSLGMISTAGVAPACRTLDCVSVFSLTVDDAITALAAMAGPDLADPFSRDRPLQAITPFPQKLRLGAPRPGQLIFFGDKVAEAAYAEAIKRWAALGAEIVEFDMEPFYETARLLYEGPWVAERYLVIRNLLASSPDAIHPVTREITAAGGNVLGALSPARPAQDRRAQLLQHGCGDAADRADGLFDQAGAGQSDRVEQPARHLHQFRQPARSLWAGAAVRHPRRRCTLRHHAAGAGRTRRAARQHRPRFPRRHQIEDRRQGPVAAAADAAAGEHRGRACDRRRRRASVGHGAERRIA